MKIFKIRHKETGLFSSGGSYPTWESNGKTWKKMGFIANHFANATGYHNAQEFYKDAEIVEYEYEPVEVATWSLVELIDNKIKAKEKERSNYIIRREKQEYEKALEIVENYRK